MPSLTVNSCSVNQSFNGWRATFHPLSQQASPPRRLGTRLACRLHAVIIGARDGAGTVGAAQDDGGSIRHASPPVPQVLIILIFSCVYARLTINVLFFCNMKLRITPSLVVLVVSHFHPRAIQSPSQSLFILLCVNNVDEPVIESTCEVLAYSTRPLCTSAVQGGQASG